MSSDFAVLAAQVLPFAKNAIAADGFLFPVAGVITAEGDFSKIVPIEEPPEGAELEEVVNGLLRALSDLARSGRARAVGWCVDMRVQIPASSQKSDAVVLFREDAVNASAVIVPYKKKLFGRIGFAPAFEQADQPRVFLGV